MLFAESQIDAALPPWAQGITLLTLLLVIVIAFMKDWVLSQKRHERELELERKVSGIWEENFKKATENNDRLVDALDPVLEGNKAILKALGEMQERRRGPQ